MDGDDGADLIAGGTGSDSILGGLGNDFINSSGGLCVQARLRPTDTWSGPPAGQTVLAQGATWGVYVETPSAGATDTLTIWSGATNPAGTDGDFVDGGAGNDWVTAGGGTDFVQGGTSNDQLVGLGCRHVQSDPARNVVKRNILRLLCTKLAPHSDPTHNHCGDRTTKSS